MNADIQRFYDGLKSRFQHIPSIHHTFKFCSRYNKCKFLVNCETKTINFDKLTEWVYPDTPVPHSADSLSFSDDYIYLIEFKSGDPTTHSNKVDKLIKNATHKINDSDDTLSELFRTSFNGENLRISEKFCLVVDSKQMGITSILTTLVNLSHRDNANMSDKEKTLYNIIYPNLKEGIKSPMNFSGIEIWYSELFESYIRIGKIKDISSFT